MSDHAPDLMPILSRGAHKDPSQGACIMEYASLLSGEGFTDTPTCTHMTLTSAAQVVNDHLDNEQRHHILPLLPALMGTGDTSGLDSARSWMVRAHLVDWMEDMAVWIVEDIMGYELVRKYEEDLGNLIGFHLDHDKHTVEVTTSIEARGAHVVRSFLTIVELAGLDLIWALYALVGQWYWSVDKPMPTDQISSQQRALMRAAVGHDR